MNYNEVMEPKNLHFEAVRCREHVSGADEGSPAEVLVARSVGQGHDEGEFPGLGVLPADDGGRRATYPSTSVALERPALDGERRRLFPDKPSAAGDFFPVDSGGQRRPAICFFCDI